MLYFFNIVVYFFILSVGMGEVEYVELYVVDFCEGNKLVFVFYV